MIIAGGWVSIKHFFIWAILGKRFQNPKEGNVDLNVRMGDKVRVIVKLRVPGWGENKS